MADGAIFGNSGAIPAGVLTAGEDGNDGSCGGRGIGESIPRPTKGCPSKVAAVGRSRGFR